MAREQWRQDSKPATLACFAGQAVDETSFMARTSNPNQIWISADWDDIIKPQNRLFCGQDLHAADEAAAFGHRNDNPEMARYLPLVSQNYITVSHNHSSTIAILIRRLGVGAGPGQLFFLGCELIPISYMEISPAIPMLEQPQISHYDRSQSHTNENRSGMETSLSKLCQVCHGIFTRPIIGAMSDSVNSNTFLEISDQDRENTVLLDQTTEELMLSAYRDCHLCFLRWESLDEERRVQAAGSPVLYSLTGTAKVDRLLMHYFPLGRKTDVKILQTADAEASIPFLSKVKWKVGILPVQMSQNVLATTYFELLQEADVATVNLPSQSFTNNCPAAWNLIRSWVDDCNANHEKCRHTYLRSNRRLPTRLIDLGDVTSSMTIKARLLSTEEMNVNTPYTTLSHCWGGLVFDTLTEANIDRLKENIDVSQLTKTFKEAMEITQKLGLRYIWIDSLCIIQGSEEDWAHEAALMGSVYEHSFCNIAASKAVNGTYACFAARHMFSVQPCSVVAQWNGREPTRYFVQSTQNLWNELSVQPLAKRRWVVQELILAPRVLHFSKTQVLWECSQIKLSESSPFRENVPQAKKITLDPEVVMNRYNSWERPESLDLADYAIWRDVVKRYSSCVLSFPKKDKLIAISGIAKLLCRGDDYLGGLWRKHLSPQMMWHCVVPHARRPTYYAPSWSWLSLDTEVIMRGTIAHEKSAFDVLNAYITPVTHDQYGAVDFGLVQILGPLAKTFCQNWYHPRSASSLQRTNRGACLFGRSLCVFYPDTLPFPGGAVFLLPFIMPSAQQRTMSNPVIQQGELTENGSPDLPLQTPDGPAITNVKEQSARLLILHRKLAGGENPDFPIDRPCGLVLARLRTRKGRYFRLGYFEALLTDNMENMQHFYELFVPERENLVEEDYEERTGGEYGDPARFRISIS